MRNLGHYNIIGDDCDIGEHVVLASYIEIRDRCVIGDHTRIGSHVVMAEGTRIGKGCQIHGGAFFADDTKLDGNKIPPIIEDYVKFGTNVKVMGGIRIGQNSIIGANSTVFRNVPAYEVWAGTPARYIRDLKLGEMA
jgi:UDP-2-acetamido-3-amino-2,3-dideoxy-glucuronate N-acetyltransferase